MSSKIKIYKNAEDVAASLNPGYPVYCLRPDVVEESAHTFLNNFPGDVLYAVKCNPHPIVLDSLYKAGIRHFDTASLPEIALVQEMFEDVHAYFMHPVKSRAAILSAKRVYGIRHYVIDHKDELLKVLQETGGRDICIVVRIATPPSEGTLYHLSSKFGATPAEAVDLLKEAKSQGVAVGLSFHVGSQCVNPDAYAVALEICGDVITKAGVSISCLDVGGGFPARYLGQENIDLISFFEAIKTGLHKLSLPPSTQILCEPGRALVAAGCSLLVQVQLRKDDRLYINDGIYGSLSEMVVANIHFPARLIRLKGAASNSTENFILNGPTCDSIDVLPGTFELPADSKEGDWIEIDQVGAYSNALATHFNGFFPETYVRVGDRPPTEILH